MGWGGEEGEGGRGEGSIKKRQGEKEKASARFRFGSPFSSKRLWFVDTVFVTLSLTINETLKWLSSLPILMEESFWW